MVLFKEKMAALAGIQIHNVYTCTYHVHINNVQVHAGFYIEGVLGIPPSPPENFKMVLSHTCA